jgi:hypothetical protein
MNTLAAERVVAMRGRQRARGTMKAFIRETAVEDSIERGSSQEIQLVSLWMKTY